MLVTRQRRRQVCWRMMFFLLVAILGLTRHSQSSPTEKPRDVESSSPASPSRDASDGRKFQDIGSPSELAWQAWLLVIAQPGAHRERNLDSATLLRRIYPKSIFWAPKRCSDGYHLDKNDNCVKNVNIDVDEHKKFIVHFLNDRFKNQEPPAEPSGLSSSGNEQKGSNGPFKLNIPLISDRIPPAPKLEQLEAEDTKNETVTVIPTEPPPPVLEEGSGLVQVNGDELEEDSQEAIAMIYEVMNDTASEEENSTLFPVNTNISSSEKAEQDDQFEPDTVVPVAEFEDDANETSFSVYAPVNVDETWNDRWNATIAYATLVLKEAQQWNHELGN